MLFHQVEGLYIDENVSFADLKQTLDYFSKEMFGDGIKIKMRPSYFPFTEPSAEVDVTCFCVMEKVVTYVNTQDGWRFWVAEWSIPQFWKIVVLIRQNIQDLLLEWALKELQC